MIAVQPGLPKRRYSNVTIQPEPPSSGEWLGINCDGPLGRCIVEPPCVRPDLYERPPAEGKTLVFDRSLVSWPARVLRACVWDLPIRRPKVIKPLSERKDAVCVMTRFGPDYVNPVPGEQYSYRWFCVQQLCKRGLKCDWIQGFAWEDKLEILNDYKYALVVENYVCENYMTEKWPHALMAGCTAVRDHLKLPEAKEPDLNVAHGEYLANSYSEANFWQHVTSLFR